MNVWQQRFRQFSFYGYTTTFPSFGNDASSVPDAVALVRKEEINMLTKRGGKLPAAFFVMLIFVACS